MKANMLCMLLVAQCISMNAYAAKMKACISNDGQVQVRQKCKREEIVLSLPSLASNLDPYFKTDINGITDISGIKTDIYGQITKYLECDERNKVSQARINSIKSLLMDIKQYAITLSYDDPPGKSGILTYLDNAKNVFNSIIAGVKSGDYSLLPYVIRRAEDYLSRARGIYAGTVTYYQIKTKVVADLNTVSLIAPPTFIPEDCNK